MTLPRGWARAVVRDLAASGEQAVLTGPFGTNMGRSDFCATGTPVLTIGCLTDKGIDLSKANYVNEAKGSELSRYALRSGDLLFSRMASVGRAGIVPEHLSGALFNYHIMRLRLDERAFLADLFVSYVRGAPEVRKYLEDVNHGATRDGINTSQLLEMPVSVPPINEQHRIVSKLCALQARSQRARQALDEVPALLEKLRQSILAAAFRGDLTKDWRAKNPDVEPAEKLLQRIRAERRKKWEDAEFAKMQGKGKVPADDRWKEKYLDPEPVDEAGLPGLPAGWRWASVDELTSAVMSVCYGVVQPGEDDPAGVPLIRVCDLSEDGFSVDPTTLRRIPHEINEDYSRSQLEGGEVLVSVVGSIGRTAIVPPTLRGANIARAVARLVFALPWLAEWTVFWFRTVYMQHRLNGDSREVARKTLNIAQLIEIPIPLPIESEAVNILLRLRSAWALIAELATKAGRSKADLHLLERAVLAKAFRGELVPQDPADEPAAEMLARLRSAAPSSTNSPTSSPSSGKRKGRPRKP